MRGNRVGDLLVNCGRGLPIIPAAEEKLLAVLLADCAAQKGDKVCPVTAGAVADMVGRVVWWGEGEGRF